MDRRSTYNYNPFDAIQPTPYVSMRNELPFDFYKLALDKGEERLQLGLEGESQIRTALGNITPFGEEGTKRYKELVDGIENNLQGFASSAGSYADPEILTKMRRYATGIGKEIKPFIDWQEMSKIDQQERYKAKDPVEVELPQTDMVDAEGNFVPYKRNWRERIDPTDTRVKVLGQIEADIISNVYAPSNIDPNAPFVTLTESTVKSIKEKVDAGANIYLNSDAGKQEILVRATQLEKEGVSRDIAIKSATQEVKESFINDSVIKNSKLDGVKLMGNPTYDRKGSENPTNSERFVTPTSFGASNENKFKSSRDLRKYSETGTQKEQIKYIVLESLNSDFAILQSQQNLSNLINKQYGVHNPELSTIKENIFDVMSQAYNNGENMPLLADLNLLEDNWVNLTETARTVATSELNGLISILNNEIKFFGGTPMNYIDSKTPESEIRKALKDLRGNKEISEFINATKEHFALMDARIDSILKERGDFAVQPVAISTYHEGYTADTKAIQQSVELTQQDNFRPIYKDQKINPDNKITDVPMISRFGNKLIFYAKDNKGNIIPVDIEDNNTRGNVLKSFQNAAFDVAEGYKNYKGVTSDGTGFKKSDGKVEKLPEGYKIEPKYSENNIYYGLYKYDNGTWNLVTVPYYYDTGEAEAKQFLPPEDFFYFKYYLDYKDKK